jgi:hypothetical protein
MSTGRAGDQVPGEPVHAGDVQVVGGLVEHEHVGRADQERGERHPPPFPAGHRADRLVQPEVWQAEPVQHRADARVAGPLVFGRESR